MNVSRIGRRRGGAGTAAAVLICVSMPGATLAAGACDDGNGTVVLTCDVHATEFRRQRLDRSLFTDVPLIQMTGRLEDRLGDLKADGAAPLAAMKGEDDTAVRASISQYRAWRAKQEAEIVERLRRETKKDLKTPRSAPAAPPVDIWSTTRVTGHEGDAAPRAANSQVGVDVRLDRNFVLGGMVELDELSEQQDPATAAALSGRSFMAGPYVAAKLNDNIALDARMAWGETSDSVAGMGGAWSMANERSLANIRLRGSWEAMNDWRFTPHATWSHAVETGEQIGADRITKNALSIVPELRRQFELPAGGHIEPFVSYRSTIELGDGYDGGLEAHKPKSAIGGGVLITKHDKYRLQATTEVEGIGEAEPTNVKSRLQLTVPLK